MTIIIPTQTPNAIAYGTILRTSTLSTDDGPRRRASSPIAAAMSHIPTARSVAYLIAVSHGAGDSSSDSSRTGVPLLSISKPSTETPSDGTATFSAELASASVLPTISSSEQPSRSHKAMSFSSSGVALPDSHFPTVCRLTPSLAATSSCVRFAERRRSDMLSLKSIRSLTCPSHCLTLYKALSQYQEIPVHQLTGGFLRYSNAPCGCFSQVNDEFAYSPIP